jgi:PAS domain S-box-containing protein
MSDAAEGPWAHDTPGARAFASAYTDYYDEVLAELEVYLSAHAVFGPMIRSLPPATREKQTADAKARTAGAFEGKWAEYTAPMRAQGAHYAMMGLRFTDWADVTHAGVRALIPRLVHRHAGDPDLLIAALASLHDFTDRGMALLAQSYVDKSEARATARQTELLRWEAVFHNVPWAMVIVGDDARVEVANPAFLMMTGKPLEAVVGVSSVTLFTDGGRTQAAKGAEIRRTGRMNHEAQVMRADGTSCPVLVDGARIPGLSDTPCWVLNITDLTERKKAERLEQRSAALEDENRRVQEASRLKSEFLANMSHELRTPLNSIIGFGELLHLEQVGPMEATQREFVGDILSSGRHLLRLINDVLDLSKVESGTMQFRPENIDVEGVANEVHGVLRSVARERSIHLALRCERDLSEITLDPARLKQVLYNYLSNAIKFSPNEGEVTLTIRPEGDAWIRIEVRDRGPGIPLEHQHRLFTEFEQLDGGRTKAHGGTGLGLALTKRLVEAQGGTVGLSSEAGHGATFFALLPRRAGRVSLPQPRRVPGVTAHAPRILVVEDDARDQERIVATLTMAGYAVDTAATGAQACALCARTRYDAITLDLLLPDGTGLDVLAAIRTQSGYDSVPVIVISVVSEEVTAGFLVHDALAKPIDPQRLLSSLRRAEIRPPASGPVLVVEDDERSAKLMATTLAQLGFKALHASNGSDALRLARETLPSAVVLDLVMPAMDGFEFLQRFRDEPTWARVPVLVWTMKDLDAAERAQLLERAQAVLHKDGMGITNLAEMVRAHLPAGPT